MKSSGQVREEIIAAAARLFARYGFKKPSIDDVAAATGIGKGSVYLHFASKEEMFAAVVRRISERMVGVVAAAVGRARSPAGKVRAFVETKQTTFAKLANEWELGEETVLELFPAASEYRRDHDAREHALLVDVLREGNASGAFDVEDPELLATGILAFLTALETSFAVKRDDASIRAGVQALVPVVVRGLARVPPAHRFDDGEGAVREKTPNQV